MTRIRKELWMTAMVLALLAGILAPATPAADRTMVLTVNEPFEINGHRFDAGEVSLRRFANYSPVASFHEVRVDGQSYGYLLARSESDSPEIAKSNHVVFERNVRGLLVLTALATKGESIRRLAPFGSPAELDAMRRASGQADGSPLVAAMQ